MPTVTAKSAVTVATESGIFMKVPHDLFNFTTADENGGLGGSVGAARGTAVPRAATSLTPATAATERGGHLQDSHFHERESLSCQSKGCNEDTV